MKEAIHPKYHEVEARCACGATWKTHSTKPELHLEICSSCHPFFTGKQKLMDTEGRVERFTKKYGAQTSESRKKAAEAKKTTRRKRHRSPLAEPTVRLYRDHEDTKKNRRRPRGCICSSTRCVRFTSDFKLQTL